MERQKGQSLIKCIEDYSVLDIETTGLTIGYDEIIEIGVIKVRNGKEIDRFQTLVQPKDFELFDPYFTGISKKSLKEAPFIETVIPPFLEFIGKDILVGANISGFDINFLYDIIFEKTNIKFQNDVIDIFRFSRKLLPELGRFPSLLSISEHLSFAGNHHRAIDDCLLTMRIYEYFKQKIRNESIDIDELFKYKNPTYKISDLHCTVEQIDDENLFYGKVIAITGALVGLTRKEALQTILNMGGIPKKHFTLDTNYLVVGTIKDEETDSIKKAQKAKLQGKDVTTISGGMFVEYCNEYFKKLKGIATNE